MKRSKTKSKKYYIFVAVVFLILFVLNKVDFDFFKSSAQHKETTSFDKESPEKEIHQSTDSVYFLPTSTTNQIIEHSTYYLSYSEPHEQAEWVAYELKKEHITGGNNKRPYFNQDPKVSTESAHWNNYKNSGYTRGHLLPAGDRTFSKEAYDETFYTSNISPQKYELNTGIWNSLEMRVRNFVRKNGKVYVVTGGILEDNLKTIGKEKVSVPDYFYKIILFENNRNYKMVAYLIPHEENERKPLIDYIVPTDSIEKLTGIDFFYFLDDTVENELEKSIDYEWFEKQ